MLISNIFVHLLHLLSILGIPQLGFGSQPTHIKAVSKARSNRGQEREREARYKQKFACGSPGSPGSGVESGLGTGTAWDYLKDSSGCLKNGYEWI